MSAVFARFPCTVLVRRSFGLPVCGYVLDKPRHALESFVDGIHLTGQVDEEMHYVFLAAATTALQAATPNVGLSIGINQPGLYGRIEIGDAAPPAVVAGRPIIIAPQMNDDFDVMTLVSTIVMLAHSLQLQVVAEGVETLDQYLPLVAMRCDQIQGFYFSRPAPAATIEAVWERNGCAASGQLSADTQPCSQARPTLEHAV